MLIPVESNVEIAGIDDLAYGRKEPFKIEITANGSPVTAYDVTRNFIQETSVPGEYKVLNVGTDTITFTIPATDLTVEENCTRILTVQKAALTVIPVDVTCKVGNVEIPDSYELSYDGFVNGEDESVLDVLPFVVCQVTESAGEGEVFAIIPTGAEDDHYDFIYREGKFTITGEQNITEHPAAGTLKAFFSKGNLYVHGNEHAWPIEVYTLQGVLAGSFDGHESIIPVSFSGTGVYLVRIGDYASKIVVD